MDWFKIGKGGQQGCVLSPCLFNLNAESVQSFSRVWLFVTPWSAACQASLSITNSWSLLKRMSIGLVMPSKHLILCFPLLLLPSKVPSIRVFSNESALCIRWPEYWSFSFSISPSDESSGLISFRMDWLDLLVVQGTHKSLLQHHSSKASILQCSAFFMVQLSYPYMTTGKTVLLTRQTFVSKVMSLLFNMLSRLVVAFLPKSKRLLISWLQLPSAVILESPKIKSDTVSIVSPSIGHEVMGPLTVWITINCGKFWKRWEYQNTWPASWETYMQVRKQQLELDMEQQTGSKLEKEFIKAVYCHPAYLTYMQSTSWETLDWKKHKLESRLLGEISITSDM